MLPKYGLGFQYLKFFVSKIFEKRKEILIKIRIKSGLKTSMGSLPGKGTHKRIAKTEKYYLENDPEKYLRTDLKIIPEVYKK